MTIPQDIAIAKLTCEHSSTGHGVDNPTPRLTWRFEGNAVDWYQSAYDIRVTRHGQPTEDYSVDSTDSVLVPWPSRPLASKERVRVSVKAHGKDGSSTAWASMTIEAGLWGDNAWGKAKMITCESQPLDQPKRPFLVRRKFRVENIEHARLYATACGVYEIEINGHKVSDQVLAPGWTSYRHRLAYQTYDVSHLLVKGDNVLGACVGEGWYNGRLGFAGGKRNIYGNRHGIIAQLVIGGEAVLSTDETWVWKYGPIVTSELYDGEVFDSRQQERSWSTVKSRSTGWEKAQVVPSPTSTMFSDRSPVKRMGTVAAKTITRSPSGKTLIDFGQNLVGWLRMNRTPPGEQGSQVTLIHAEVLENGELGVRPLRIAKCRDVVTLGGDLAGWEPKFTFHGFRYAQVEGWPYEELKLEDLDAIVVHTDMERLGHFECSHPLINQLHSNVVWGMKGNFLSVPTDCPQRDERLGWTGDLQVFAKTASFLYDTSSMLSAWLEDVAAEQLEDNGGVPSLVVPNCLGHLGPPQALAVWGDVAVLTPWDLYNASGDRCVLEQQYESMIAWLAKGIKRSSTGLWDENLWQFGDWLAPDAPPDFPGDCRTDPQFVANAYLLHVTRQVSRISEILGHKEESVRYAQQYDRLRATFLAEFISPNGRPVSDSQTAIALALHFNILGEAQRQAAVKRLEYLVKQNVFKVGTGFAGTPIILDVLAANDCLHLAYRMLQEKQCPSWLYCVSQGATTIWERWDSMMQDGTINPGEMTSFNHYALGAVANFMHSTIGGITLLEPGWKRVLISPRPGGTVTSATVSHVSPYGTIECSWVIKNQEVIVHVVVPPNTSARVVLPGVDVEVGSGKKRFVTKWEADLRWPPKPIHKSMTIPLIDEIA